MLQYNVVVVRTMYSIHDMVLLLGMGQFINGECVLGISRQQSNLHYTFCENLYWLQSLPKQISKITHTRRKKRQNLYPIFRNVQSS